MTKARENSDYTGLQGDLALKSPVASPVFTGNVGIGVTPEAWQAGWTAQQIGARSNTVYTAGGAFRTNNAYRDSVNSRWEYQATDEACMYELSDSGTHGFYVAPSGTADAAISWTTAMTIDNSGNVLVNKTSQDMATVGAQFRGDAVGLLQVTRDGAEALHLNRLTSGGDIAKFYKDGTAVGSIGVNASATSFNTSSDYRLKENVTPMSGATAQTKLLKPCNFDWITGGNVNGFIAHELAEVVPEAVTGTKDAMRDEDYEVTPATDTEAAVMGTRSVPDMQGIDQSKLVPLLTATIQELIARIEALEA